MNLVNLSIQILWLAIGVIIICGIVWVALWAVKQVLPVPAVIERVIWAVVVILILIAILTMIAGGGGTLRTFRLGNALDLPGPAYASGSSEHLQRLLDMSMFRIPNY